MDQTLNKLTHQETCPLGRAVDKQMDRDRRWFAKRPGALVRSRPISAAESAEMVVTCGLPPETRIGGMVTVRYIGQGVRIREFTDLHVVGGDGE
ncbi:hypothetical protein GV792_07800 [Nocardia cyriacigeorgica]|uniref:hypothetical protein n=1 Tax=Nocardia cyriacigeorgica TaxID=135487 RepID=UPI0013BD9D49|nr:hypothetical protein [Nocardia cyriacigeorgica]NEW49956.1 hypothetical protein [Nocardia cyriacigeorgica]